MITIGSHVTVRLGDAPAPVRATVTEIDGSFAYAELPSGLVKRFRADSLTEV